MQFFKEQFYTHKGAGLVFVCIYGVGDKRILALIKKAMSRP
jgi:hypothetical protein